MAVMGMNMNNPYMQNPFLQNLSTLMYANPAGHPWGPQLSSKAVASMWMNAADAKQLAPQHEEEEVFKMKHFSYSLKYKADIVAINKISTG